MNNVAVSPSELEKGMTTKQISELLFISQSTVKTHLASIYRKLGQATYNKYSEIKQKFERATDQIETSPSNIRDTTQPTKPLLARDNDISKPEIPVQNIESSIEKTVSRVLIFYTDHTFEDFRPAK